MYRVPTAIYPRPCGSRGLDVGRLIPGLNRSVSIETSELNPITIADSLRFDVEGIGTGFRPKFLTANAAANRPTFRRYGPSSAFKANRDSK